MANMVYPVVQAVPIPMSVAPPPMMMGVPMQPDASGLPPYLAALARHPRVEIKEKLRAGEAIAGLFDVDLELANKYKVFAEGGQHELLYAVEKTDCFTRQLQSCVPDCAPWQVEVMYTEAGQRDVAFRMVRPFTPTCLCFNRPFVQVIDSRTNTSLGSIKDPFRCCDMTFHILDASGRPAIEALGGCCQLGLLCPLPCGPCAEVEFPVVDALSRNKIGHIQKKVAGLLSFLVAGDVDNYKIDFGAVQNPQWKALLVALSIFIDFRYFNKPPGN